MEIQWPQSHRTLLESREFNPFSRRRESKRRRSFGDYEKLGVRSRWGMHDIGRWREESQSCYPTYRFVSLFNEVLDVGLVTLFPFLVTLHHRWLSWIETLWRNSLHSTFHITCLHYRWIASVGVLLHRKSPNEEERCVSSAWSKQFLFLFVRGWDWWKLRHTS